MFIGSKGNNLKRRHVSQNDSFEFHTPFLELRNSTKTGEKYRHPKTRNKGRQCFEEISCNLFADESRNLNEEELQPHDDQIGLFFYMPYMYPLYDFF